MASTYRDREYVTPTPYVGTMSFHTDDESGGGIGRDVAADLALTRDGQLEASIVALEARIDAAHAELALRVAEYDRRHVADHRTC